METNLFGALWVTQAALPIMREQGSGHIIQVSSIGGITAFPGIGAYHASKWALEGFTQSLAREVAELRHQGDAGRAGRVRHRLGRAVLERSERLPAYDEVRESRRRAPGGNVPGDPEATRGRSSRSSTPTSRRCASSSARRPSRPPTRDYESRLATWNEWQPVSVEAFGAPQARRREFPRRPVIWSPDGARRPPRHVRGGDLGIARRARRPRPLQDHRPPRPALPRLHRAVALRPARHGGRERPARRVAARRQCRLRRDLRRRRHPHLRRRQGQPPGRLAAQHHRDRTAPACCSCSPASARRCASTAART